MERTIIERTACNQSTALAFMMLKRPINPVSKRFMLVKPFRYLVASTIRK